jgi:hypothetical protein
VTIHLLEFPFEMANAEDARAVPAVFAACMTDDMPRVTDDILAVHYNYNVGHCLTLDDLPPLPPGWTWCGGGFTKFMLHFLSEAKEFQGPSESVDEARTTLSAFFAAQVGRGVLERFLIVDEPWDPDNGGSDALRNAAKELHDSESTRSSLGRSDAPVLHATA